MPLEVHVITKEEQEMIQILLESGAFNMRSGHITIHFDETGKIRLVEAKKDIYRYTSSRQKTAS